MNNLVETVVTFYGIDRATAERGAEMFLDVFPSLPAEFQILLIKHARSTVKVISAFEAQRAGAR